MDIKSVIILLATAFWAVGCAGDGKESDRSKRPEAATASVRPATRPAGKAATCPSAPEPSGLGRRAGQKLLRFAGVLETAWRQGSAALTAGIAERIDDPDFCLHRGDQALGAGAYEAAYRYFLRADRLGRRPLDAWRGQAIALVALGRHREAIGLYQRLLAESPDDRVAAFNLAVAYDHLDKWPEAERAYRRLIAMAPDHLRGRHNLAAGLQAHGRLTEARRQWQNVLALAPDRPDAWAALGEVLADLGEPAAAVNAFASAAKRQPDVVGHWANLGLAAYADGQLGRAMAAYERAVTLDGNNAALWRRLGLVRLTIHRTAGDKAMLGKAAEAWRRSLTLDPDQPDLRRWLDSYGPADPGTPTTAPAP